MYRKFQNKHKDFEKALGIGWSPNVARLFPHSRALIVSGKAIDRAMTIVVKFKELDHKILVQGMIAKSLVRTFVIVTFLTMAILFLQGFDFCHFQLPESILKWLGAATVGEVAGLLIIIIKAVFPKNK